MADDNEDDVANELYDICFRDDVWLQQNILSRANVLDYFSRSDFYDKSCVNQYFKMQGTMITTELLKKNPGLQYSVVHANDESKLYVIMKARTSNTGYKLIKAYHYILDGSIYQAPTVNAVLSTRLINFSFHMNKFFTELRKFAEFSPRDGHSWTFYTENKKAKRKRKNSSSANTEDDQEEVLPVTKKRLLQHIQRSKYNFNRIQTIVGRLGAQFHPNKIEIDKKTPTSSSSTADSISESKSNHRQSSSKEDRITI